MLLIGGEPPHMTGVHMERYILFFSLKNFKTVYVFIFIMCMSGLST